MPKIVVCVCKVWSSISIQLKSLQTNHIMVGPWISRVHIDKHTMVINNARVVYGIDTFMPVKKHGCI